MRALAVLTASVVPLVLGGRCFPQLLQSVGDGTITLYNTTSKKEITGVPEGIPPQPAMPGNGPFFTAVLDDGQLCYTGGASGTVKPVDDCSCSVAFKAYEQALFEAEQNPSQFDDAQIQNIADAGESLASTGCVDLETQALPPYLFKNFSEFRKKRIPRGTHKVSGRICLDPEVRVSNEARSEKLMSPWEFSNIRSSKAACTCPRDVEYFSRNYDKDDGAVSSYVDALESFELLKPLTEGSTRLKTSGNSLTGTCNVNRNGYGWAGTGVTGVPISGSGTSSVRVNATETEIPVYPGGPTASCGGVLEPNERINFCLYKLEETRTALPVTPSAVAELSDYCNNPITPERLGDNRFTKCCMNATVSATAQQETKTSSQVMVRRDLMVTIQCRATQFALNSGTGRFHTVPNSPFDDTSARVSAAVRSAGGVETNFMPDLSPQTLGLRRNRYSDQGFSDVCIPKRRKIEDAKCTKYVEFDITKDKNAHAAGVFEDLDATVSTDCNRTNNDLNKNAQANEWAQTTTGNLLSLRRAAMSLNACVMPSTYASSPNKRNGMSPCDIFKHFNMMAQLFTDPNLGWTEEDFEECTIEDVPGIAVAWYKAIMGIPIDEDPTSQAPTILKFWASMPPAFYLGSASFPAAIADYFTTKENQCLPNVPGRGVGESTGTQGPSAGGASPPDPEAICSSQGCCPGMQPPPDYTGNLTDVCCKDASSCLCFTGTNPAEIVFTRMDNSMIQKLVEDCLNYDYNTWVSGDPPDSNRFCVHAGQYVTDTNTIWKQAGTTQMFENGGTPTECQDASTGRIRYTDDGADLSIIFVATAPRMRGVPLHPIFQTANYVGGALQPPNFNYTTTEWGPTKAFSGSRDCALAGGECRPIFYSTGQKAGTLKVPIREPIDKNSNTSTYDGIELALVIEKNGCFTKNHRETINTDQGESIIRIPGLFPRWIDIQQGGTPILPNAGDPCLVFDNGDAGAYLAAGDIGARTISNWKTHGDRFGVDIYNWGGGLPPFSPAQGNAFSGDEIAPGFMPAHTVGYYGGEPFSQDPRPMLPTLGTCLIESPARCNAKCNLGDMEASIGEGIGLAFAALAVQLIPGVGEAADEAGGTALVGGLEDGGEETEEAAFRRAAKNMRQSAADENPSRWSKFSQGVKNKLTPRKLAGGVLNTVQTGATAYLGTQSVTDLVEAGEVGRIASGKNVYDVSSESSGSGSPVAVKLGSEWKSLFQARLEVVNDKNEFVFITGRTTKTANGLLDLYKFHPSAIRACLYENSGDETKCIGPADNLDNPTQSFWNDKTSGNPSARYQGLSRNAMSAEAAANDMRDNGDYKNCANNDKQNINVGPGKGTDVSWWAGRTSMLETTSIGSQFACHIAHSEGSGNFKLQGKFARSNKFRFVSSRYRAEKSDYIKNTAERPTIEFNSVEADAVKAMLDGNLYTAVDGNGDSLDIMSDFGPAQLCGLCGNIGAATATSPIREGCTMAGDDGVPRFVQYDIEDSLGVFDRHANAFFDSIGVYDKNTPIQGVNFTYFDVIGETADVETAATFNGDTVVERLLGVDLTAAGKKRAAKTPACIGNLHAANVPYCEIDMDLQHAAKQDAPACKGTEETFGTTCPNPRWANDKRLTFPRTVPLDANPPPTSADYDARAANLSYCANGPWNFSDSNWYKAPPRGWEQPGDTPAPLPFALSKLDPDSKEFVYCDADRFTPAERREFCAGSTDKGRSGIKPEGFLTHFGIRAGVKSEIGDVCHLTPTGGFECIVYANTTVGAFRTIQSVIDAFPDRPSTEITIIAVPLAEHVVSLGILQYMTDVSTLYYNSAENVGEDAYVESASSEGGILGKAMGISYEESAELFPGLCFSHPKQHFFAALYATIESFRAANSTTFKFVNIDGISRSDRFQLELPEEEVYPAHTEDRIDFGSRIVSIKSPFTEEVAESATVRLRAKSRDSTREPLPPRKFRFAGVLNPQSGCTRILLAQPNITLTDLEFRQGGLCTQLVAESDRVPILASGSRVANLRIINSVCVDCTAGLLGVRGGDAQLGTDDAAANVDVDGVLVYNSEFLWTSQNGQQACSADKVSQCQNSTLPGVETSFARIVGSPTVTNCPLLRTTSGNRAVDEFCNLVMQYPPIQIRHAQFPGKPIASRNSKTGSSDTECASECDADLYSAYNSLYAGKSLKPCCDGLDNPTLFTCPTGATEYTRTALEPATDECSYANCLWNKMSDKTNFKPEWIDVELDSDDIGEGELNADLCRAFFRMCLPVCEDGQTSNCNVCLGKDVYTKERCGTLQQLAADFAPSGTSADTLTEAQALRLIRQNPIQPPCAETGYALFTNDLKITSQDPTQFTKDVIIELVEANVGAQTCSALGCPRVQNHTTTGPLSVDVAVCVGQNIPATLRQAWFVRASAENGPPVFDVSVDIVSPGNPTTNFASPFKLNPGSFLDGASSFQISNAYNDAGGSDSVLMAQIRLSGAAGVTEPVCLTRNASQTATGTESGGLLTAQPCALENPAQDFLFVLHQSIRHWRIQIPDDPFLCITSETDPVVRSCPDDPSAIKSAGGGTLCSQVYPHTTELTSVPGAVVTACYPCSVGVDVSGTTMGPVVSSVLDLPSIVKPKDILVSLEDVQFIPLSVSNFDLALAVNTTTGMCLRFGAVSTSPSFAAPEITGSKIVAEVPCSLLEGAPVEQLEEIAGPDVCDNAAGLLVAPCLAKTGGLSFVDGSPGHIRALCARIGVGVRVQVKSTSGKEAAVECVSIPVDRPTDQPDATVQTLQVVARGFGFQDNDVLTAVAPENVAQTFNDAGEFYAVVSKLIWQPHESAGTPASAPIVGSTTVVFNVTQLFGIFGEDRLFAVFSAGVTSATAAYIVIVFEIVVLVSVAAYHLYFFFRSTKAKG